MLFIRLSLDGYIMQEVGMGGMVWHGDNWPKLPIWVSVMHLYVAKCDNECVDVGSSL